MHVILDGRVMAEQYSGLGRYTGELLFALLDDNSEKQVQYSVLIWEDPNVKQANAYYSKLKDYQEQGICKVISVDCKPISINQHFTLSRHINTLGGDIYFYPHFDLPLGIKLPCISVVHDLSPIKVKEYISKNRWIKVLYFKLMLRLSIRKAKFVFAVSETTKRDLLDEVGSRFSDKVGVSLEGPMLKVGKNSQTIAITLPKKFLLYVGVRRPHKNVKRMLDLFIALKDNSYYSGDLVIAGSIKNYDFDLESYIINRKDIHILGQLDDAKLVVLYERMDSLVFLSKYEGFGLPVVESASFNKKMILSDGGALVEVAPPWAFILPNDADFNNYLPKIGEYLSKEIIVNDDYIKQYTWGSVATRIRQKFVDIQKSKQ